MVVSFNITLEDTALLHERPGDFQQMLQSYSAKRIVCNSVKGEEVCGVESEVLSPVCPDGTKTDGCIPLIPNWSDGSCHMGICKLEKYVTCVQDGYKEIFNVSVEGDISRMATKIELLHRTTIQFCLNVYESTVEIYITGLYMLKLDPKVPMVASFVNSKTLGHID